MLIYVSCLQDNKILITVYTYSAPISHIVPTEGSSYNLFQPRNITSTKKAYMAGLRQYTTFCNDASVPFAPLSEDTLMLFATYLAQQDLSYATI